jgi:MFS family permease
LDASANQASTKTGIDVNRLFITSCISLVTTSMVFSIRGDIEPAMGQAFQLTHEQMGTIWSPALWAFTIAIFISGALGDVIGLRSLHALSAIGYIVGVVLVLVAPHPTAPVAHIFETPGTLMLYAGFLIMGLSQGLVEGVINPLIATLYRDNKTHKLNVLHSWWPGGLVIGGLLAYALTQFNVGWEIKLSLIMVPAAVYLLMSLSQPYPQTERVVSNVSTGDMWKEALRPLFLVLFICMWLTAASELAPDQWFPSVMGAIIPAFKGGGVLFLVYTAGLMFLLRFFGASLVHKISPLRTLLICSVLTAAGLYWLGSLHEGASPVIAFAAATIFALGKTYYWPTMLGITSEQFPKGGALLISLMGGAGMLSVAVAIPLMGSIFDKAGPGAALQYMAILPAILILVFAGFNAYFSSKGGYKVVHLATEEPIPAGEM